MSHFGLVCPPGTSHVTGLTTIARELCRRGHRATIFNIADVEGLAQKEGMAFHPLGAKDHPKGSFAKFSEKFSHLHGMEALQFGIKIAINEIVMLLEEAPEAMRRAGVTALLIDQGQVAGSTLAERLDLPFISICNAVPFDPDIFVPPSFTSWEPPTSWLGRLRIRAAYRALDWATTPMRHKINSYRKTWGFKALHSVYDSFFANPRTFAANGRF